MAKTPKLKKKPTSIHSRAARRAASPSDDLDKSIKSAPRVEEPFKPDAILARHANAGVTKKKPTAKKLTRTQRLRRQKGIERAEKVLDRLEVKIKKSEGKAKKVKARKVKWEDIAVDEVKPVSLKKTQTQIRPANDDVDMEEDGQSSNALPAGFTVPSTTQENVPPQQQETHDEDDEIT